MKYFFKIILLLILIKPNAFAESKWGRGEINLHPGVAAKFVEYVKGSTTSKAPYLFAVSMDGNAYSYLYCSAGMNNCKGGDSHILQNCERSGNGVECKLFARNRTIKWDNGINTGKGKKSKINSKLSEKEIFARLTELGFLGDIKNSNNNQESSNKNNSKKEIITDIEELQKLQRYLKLGIIDQNEFNEKKKLLTKKLVTKQQDTSSNITSSDIVTQIKELKQLMDDGVLTKDEFEKAKKKILN